MDSQLRRSGIFGSAFTPVRYVAPAELGHFDTSCYKHAAPTALLRTIELPMSGLENVAFVGQPSARFFAHELLHDHARVAHQRFSAAERRHGPGGFRSRAWSPIGRIADRALGA